MAVAPKAQSLLPDAPAQLAQRLLAGLLRERLVPHFVDSYVVEHGRYGLQVHATLYRDLLGLIQREALLAMSARSLEILSRGSGSPDVPAFTSLKRKDTAAFRQKFLAALTRQQQWNAGESLEFQTDLAMYEDILARAAAPKRQRKPFEVANHPFVDRCAFVLDSSFLEKARLAATRALAEIEDLTLDVLRSLLSPAKAGEPTTKRR